MAKNFELDMTQAMLPAWWAEHGLPLKIKLRPGEWESDFDIDDAEVNRVARQIDHVVGSPNKPVGLDVTGLSVGAVIRRLPD